MTSSADSAKTVSDYWAADRSRRRESWLQHPVAVAFVNRRVSGDPEIGTVTWFRDKFIPEPLELCLSLGCGHGYMEQVGIALGIAKKFHAIDVSDGAIAGAKAAAATAGIGEKIDYSVADLNTVSLPAATYDAIFGISAVHHIFQLEHLFSECRKALKPGGLLFLDEYVGPSRFCSAPHVIDLINRLRVLLPEHKRKNLFTNDGNELLFYEPLPIGHFEKHDPSEAVRSSEIMAALRLYFDVLEIRPYGGAIQHMLFSGIAGNFDETNAEDVALMNVIATFEEALETEG
ncbi:MAG: hypothetical protein QOH67_1641, partial [Hyphomicrobiales bacterium]|nr:hypothetical protein [Hyphomicrobiales bacterium]